MSHILRKENWIHSISLWLFLVFLSCNSNHLVDEQVLPKKVDFNYHIKPILSDRCFACHGPDENALKADLHLNTPEGALKTLLESGGYAIVPGQLQQSEVYHRITSEDPEYMMPPPESDLELSEHEVALITKWIEQGAEYKPHWAFLLPVKLDPPKTRNSKWANNPIDQFVLKKLEGQKLKPSKSAKKELLLRRVTLDLTGLPPTIKEIDDFLNDQGPYAFEKVVDRLLSSPRYGERMALEWLDVARYADSHGYSTDGYRVMWPWRDWVINAFNENMPFDQFINWQLAGDRIPNPTQEQRLATAFLRNQKMNAEGGIILEEYLHEYAADRTETFATAFLGLTMQCAKCHDHKYDPFTQKDYYRLLSYFNNVNERGIVQNDYNSGPQVQLTTGEIDVKLDSIDVKIANYQTELSSIKQQFNKGILKSLNQTSNLRKGLLVDTHFDKLSKNQFLNHADKTNVLTTTGNVEMIKRQGIPAYQFSAYNYTTIRNKSLNFARSDPFSFSFWINSGHENDYMIVLNNAGGKNNSYIGYEFVIVEGHPTIRLIHAKPANMIEVRTSEIVPQNEWVHLSFTYDGSGSAEGIEFYWNGVKTEKITTLDQLTKTMINHQNTMRIGGRTDYQVDTRGKGIIDNLKIYNRELTPVEVLSIYRERPVDPKDFSIDEQLEYYLRNHRSEYEEIIKSIQNSRWERNLLLDSLPSVMVMQDLDNPRQTFVLDRGIYNAPGELVHAALPAIFKNNSVTDPQDRLELANWVVGKNNPLTARVIVNRYWQMYFGRGLVSTTEDFGNQGALPSHPELLDWLACFFMESGWNTKELQKLIVTSSTYRQTSTVTVTQRESDPDNILLARGPRFRLQAELIRDCALAASELLSDSIGGSSAKPYQPKGLWAEKNSFGNVLLSYTPDKGEQAYRRGLYTFWRRTSPPPSMITFDAPTRDNCIVKREQTNTPLQALVLLNDPQFVESSRVMAENIVRAINTPERRVTNAYRKLTSLHPDTKVLGLLKNLYDDQMEIFTESPELAEDFRLIGNTAIDSTLSAVEVAAMGVVCNTILSFDETIVKR